MTFNIWRFMLKFLLLFMFSLPCFAFQTPLAITLTDKNSVSFNQPVKADYVAKKQIEIINKVSKLAPHEPLYLVLDTPGGSVLDGLLFIDTIKALNRPIHTITIFAASMGYQIAQELGHRYITPSGTLMSHRGAVSGLSGQVPGELNSRLKYLENLLHRMNVNAAKRTKVSLKDYQNSIVNELWTSGQEAVNMNQADTVVLVKCDKDLMDKTYTESVNVMILTIDVKYSACPLISGPIGFGGVEKFTRTQIQTIKSQLEKQKRNINLVF